ncbi:Putative BRCT domain superfamily protein [Septoria linicola]|uniref:BRCT domain superfamily protein n=1 Tax=Septoria linicola TaxID=215465 RepID=A0A9Q9AHF0_9PEZI|nr:putative BRCT domain superfamily protein [Septoria linicola]USW49459.1 Putative BRCT domain superfamily protein [Septoria linicola]
MAGGKSVYIVTGEEIIGVYSTENAANAVMETITGAVVETHEIKTTGKKGGAKRSSSDAADGSSPAAKKSKKADATPLTGVADVFMGKNICFLGTMKLRRDALEKSATNHGGTITKKAEDADIIVKGAHISEGQSKDLTDNGRETITEQDFKVWLTTGEEQ